MIYRDLEAVPAITMPGDLELRPVTRLDEAVPNGVDLEEAAATAIRADPRITEPPESFVAFLRSLPSETRLFAAVDSNGVVRATSGFIAFGEQANVFFINTDQAWRGRGIGSAMTAAALRAAKDRGVRQACLDATNAGLSIYVRLGFEVVGEARRFLRTA
jgi:ribosomal protein S18 acetylase RimI-like enzyme